MMSDQSELNTLVINVRAVEFVLKPKEHPSCVILWMGSGAKAVLTCTSVEQATEVHLFVAKRICSQEPIELSNYPGIRVHVYSAESAGNRFDS